jgi:cation diffusion facilitator CzcD-associated flavoprotein CzcO
MVRAKKVCVIGAGVSGLVSAKVFKERGHAVTILERSAGLGGVWEPSRSYPGVRTQSPKSLYRFTDRPMPDAYPEWPKGPQVHAYLAGYAQDHGLMPLLRFGTAVSAMERRTSGQGWTLTVRTGGATTQEDYDFVVVCTGQFSDKNVLTHPGLDAFKSQGGTVLHSSDYTDPALVKGKRVVVLGASKSATDIAVNAVEAGAAAVTNVYLEPMWRVPYFVGGLVNFKHVLYMRAQEEMFRGWGLSRLSRLNHILAKPIVWFHWRGLEALLKTQFKLKACNMVPKGPIEASINCSTPIATEGYFPMVKDGRIKAVQGTIDRYDGGTVVLSGGERVEADVVVLAVGWKLGVPFLSAPDRKRLIEPDGLYRLYRIIANPDLPDMGFVGFNSSFCTTLSAELAANWLVRYADGQLKNQPTPAAMRADIDAVLHWKRVERPAAQVYGGLCAAPYHFRHFDELLSDMGARTRRSNPIVEKFTPPDADAYAAFLAGAPSYQATAA